MFEVASLFIGIGQAKVVLKGASLTEKITVAMEKVAALLAKLKLPAAIKLIPQRLSKLVKATVFAMTFTVGIVSTELATVIPKAGGVLEYVIQARDNVANATSRVATLVAENAAKIEATATSVAKTENAVLKVADKAGNLVELGAGKLIVTAIGSHLVLPTVIDSRILNIQAIDKITATVSILVAGTGTPTNEMAVRCARKNQNPSVKRWSHYAIKPYGQRCLH